MEEFNPPGHLSGDSSTMDVGITSIDIFISDSIAVTPARKNQIPTLRSVLQYGYNKLFL